MIYHFPKPYPSEWWYSVLSRFRVQSGCINTAKFHQHFFGTKAYGCASAFPTSSLTILKYIPQGLLDENDIIKNHTVIPFYTRIYTKEQRQRLIASCLSNGGYIPSHVSLDPMGRAGCRYCPVCYDEDKKKYGEPYWHREHQIPLLTICPQHKCKLVVKEHPINWWSLALIPLSQIDAEDNADYNVNTWEKEVARCVMDYLTLPDSVCRILGFNNLCDTLLQKGYQAFTVRGKKCVQEKNLYGDLKKKYGESVFNIYFNKDSKNLLHLLREWRLSTPDRYILIQCLIGLSTRKMLSHKSIRYDAARTVLLKMKEGDYIVTPAHIAKTLGIAPHRVPEIARKCGVEPFWKYGSGAERVTYKRIHVNVSKDEYDIIEAFRKKRSSMKMAAFIREYLLQQAETDSEKSALNDVQM